MILRLGAQWTNEDQLPMFGTGHLDHLAQEAALLQPDGPPLIALAHGCHHRQEGWRQHSTLFLFIPKSSHVQLTVTVGNTNLFQGEAYGNHLQWIFIDWRTHPGDLTIQIDNQVGILTAREILQTTDMRCILRHPPITFRAVEAEAAA